MKKRSSSARLSCVQVGRPWLHWSARSVASMSRSRAFISGRVSWRLARTAPWQAMVASSSLRRAVTTSVAGNSRSSCSSSRTSSATGALASSAGTLRTTSSWGPAAAISKPMPASTSVHSSAAAMSFAPTENTAGISRRCTAGRPSITVLSFS